MPVFPSLPEPTYPLKIEPQFSTLISDFQTGKEQRRQVWAFPKRLLVLQFETLLQTEIDILYNFFLARKGSFEPFYYFWLLKDENNNWPVYAGEYIYRGNGTQTLFDLPGKSITGLTVYVNGVVTPATFSSGSGPDGVDQINFNTTGAIISSSVANPTVITTTAAHGLVTGNKIIIAGHTGSTPAISGIYTVTVINSTTFTIPVNVTVGGTGGTWTINAPDNGATITADFQGQLRLRVRFKSDNLSKELFTWVLYNASLELYEVRA